MPSKYVYEALLCIVSIMAYLFQMLRQLSLKHVHDALFWVSLYKGRIRIG